MKKQGFLKRSVIFFFALVFAAGLLTLIKPIFVSAQAKDVYAPKEEINEQSATNLSARSNFLMDFNTGTVLLARNEDDKYPIASMVKIMTLNLCLEDLKADKFKLDDMISVSDYAASMGGSQAFLDANGQYKAADLLKTISIASANDSCVAMAEHLEGSVEGFVTRMNEKAKELGMHNTVFTNCTGLPGGNHYSTAKDVALMTRELLKFNEYYSFSSITLDELTHEGGRKTQLANTNKLLKSLQGCDAGKTGFTNEAKFCMSASAKRGDMRLISVVLGCDDSKTRFANAAKMINYGFANYENKKVVAKDTVVETPVNVAKGKKSTVNAVVAKDIFVFSGKTRNAPNIEISEFIEDAKAPLSQGDVVGKIVVKKDGVVIDESNLLATESVAKKTLGDYIKQITQAFMF